MAALTENQSRQLMALLEAGALSRKNAAAARGLTFSSFDVLAILAHRNLAGSTRDSRWFLTPEGEAEARRLVRELSDG